ncbi:hypothetical protein E2C01_031693 [Portunus trituberculatus]|uniref:Uncharacterized protein n=1 Tax=Portunus trituberculatus TaxID=210409 RepID=A0A5B7EYT6_PORTR|nr:hypothetical protein [Portunus trituberculatus]
MNNNPYSKKPRKIQRQTQQSEEENNKRDTSEAGEEESTPMQSAGSLITCTKPRPSTRRGGVRVRESGSKSQLVSASCSSRHITQAIPDPADSLSRGSAALHVNHHHHHLHPSPGVLDCQWAEQDSERQVGQYSYSIVFALPFPTHLRHSLKTTCRHTCAPIPPGRALHRPQFTPLLTLPCPSSPFPALPSPPLLRLPRLPPSFPTPVTAAELLKRRLFCTAAFSSSVYQFGWRFVFLPPSSSGRRGEGDGWQEGGQGGTSILRCTKGVDECVRGRRFAQYAYNQEINAGPS